MKFNYPLIAALALLATGRGALAADAAGGVKSSVPEGLAEKPASQAAKPKLPKEKQTTLGLYLTAKEAYDKPILRKSRSSTFGPPKSTCLSATPRWPGTSPSFSRRISGTPASGSSP